MSSTRKDDSHREDLDAHFTALELAFFREGDELSKRPLPPVDTFEDLVS